MPESVGAGAAVIGRQVPSRPGRLQVCAGSVHAVSQHTVSTQLIDRQSLPLAQAAPFSPGGVLVGVGVLAGADVRVEVAV